jgi:hypothetical protein
VILAVTMGAALRWRYVGGFVALLLSTLWASQFWTGDWFTTSLFGISLIYVGAQLGRGVSGEGRLAWQRSQIGPHPMLWHNGMVGGSASFLGVVEDLELGVVVLTNTARSVDALGVKILAELVKLKARERTSALGWQRHSSTA